MLMTATLGLTFYTEFKAYMDTGASRQSREGLVSGDQIYMIRARIAENGRWRTYVGF